MTKRQKNTWEIGFATMTLISFTMPAAAFTVPVPEPDTLLLLVAGVAAVFLAGRFRGRK